MSDQRVSDQGGIAGALRGQRILITGATGFLGKVLVEKLLWSVPAVEKLLLLIRPGAGATAAERLDREVLGSPVMARLRALHGDRWQQWVRGKVAVVEGDLGRDRLGLSTEAYRSLTREIDRVVSSAATVTFNERLDRALELNTRGALRILELARDAGEAPLLHVSTCFVSGRQGGDIPERVVTPEALDGDAVLARLEETCAALEATGTARERDWVASGSSAAERFGFHDVYILTKALAERLLDLRRGSVPLAILRPAIVESAATEPFPGWIEAVRVCDPLLVAYGRGRTDELPGSADGVLELIPVDHVANALIAAMASLPERPAGSPSGNRVPPRPVPVYQLGSRRNPIRLGELMSFAREGFTRTPLRDGEGNPISVGEARFTEPEAYRRALVAKRRLLHALSRWWPGRRTSRRRLELGRAERSLDHLVHLLEVYRPYLTHGARYDDTATRRLWEELSPEEREAFPFDVTAIRWPAYVADVHVPGLVRFALKAESGAPPPAPEKEREAAPDILHRAVAHGRAANTLFDLFASTARAYPDGVAFQTFRDGRWLRYTYRQALGATANFAFRLARQYGIGRGDRVLLWAAGSPEWALATFSVHRLGAAIVPLDPQWPAAEVVQAARLVGAKLICATPALIGALAAGEGPDCPVVALAAPLVPEPQVGPLPGAEAVGSAGEPGDLASIIFTSGTTVAPKAVPLSHANYLANVRDLIPLMRLTRERLLSVLPVHHVFEQMVGLLVPMAGGSTVSYVAELKPAEISWMMATTRPTVLVAVPRLLELLHGGIQRNVEAGGPMLKLLFRILFALSRRRDGENGHRLFAKVHRRFGGSLRRIASGGSALDPGLGRRFQLMGFQIAEGYGMTETSPVLTVNPWDAVRFGSVGRPLPGVEIELREPPEVAGGLAPGAGEVWVRGANVMAGYYRNPEATATVMDDGWLNTGDIGSFDGDGYLYLAGRTKDVIVTAAGKNVYPEEVEARYSGLPGVAELVVLGLPGDGGGERVVALVVPAPDADEGALRAAFAERSKGVPSYQQVAGVEIWCGELPKTTTMKVQRAKLRDAVVAGERGSASTPARSPAPAPAESRAPAEQAVVDTVARLTRTRPDLLRGADRLTDLGVDSLTRVELIGELEARFGLRLDDEAAASLERLEDLFELTS